MQVLDEKPFVRAGITRAISQTKDIIVVNTDDSASSHNIMTSDVGSVPTDVIILDINEPSATQTISSVDDPECRLVGYSEISEATLLRSVLANGVKGIVHRSESPELLIAAIRAAAANKQYLSPETERILTEGFEDSQADSSKSAHSRKRNALRAIEALTPREVQVLRLITEGNSTTASAEALGLSVKTIETHRKNIGDKIGTRNLATLTKIAILAGLIDL